MSFTPGMGSAVLVGSTEPSVVLQITPIAAPSGFMTMTVIVNVNPGESYAWSGSAPTTGGPYTAYGFRASSGTGIENLVRITYTYKRMSDNLTSQDEEGHTFYLHT